jgi:hypothetical protein
LITGLVLRVPGLDLGLLSVLTLPVAGFGLPVDGLDLNFAGPDLPARPT